MTVAVPRVLLVLLVLLNLFRAPAWAQAPTGLSINIVEGEGAINNIRQRVNREPIVQVEDQNHKPIAGAVVVFLLPDSGASGTFPDGSHMLMTVTDNQGRALARGIRPNGQSGPMQIRVTALSGSDRQLRDHADQPGGGGRRIRIRGSQRGCQTGDYSGHRRRRGRGRRHRRHPHGRRRQFFLLIHCFHLARNPQRRSTLNATTILSRSVLFRRGGSGFDEFRFRASRRTPIGLGSRRNPHPAGVWNPGRRRGGSPDSRRSGLLANRGVARAELRTGFRRG